MDRELQYVLFMAERSIEDARNMAYIQECLVLAEGTNVVERITVINEGVVDKAKAAWAKVKEWVKNVWAKFTEKFNKLAMQDADYLKEYSEIILKRQPVDATYTMLNYPDGIYRCTQVKVPVLNYSSMKAQLKDEQTFLKSVISDYDGRTNPKDFISTYFKGGSDDPQSIHVSKLKFGDMYDFCIDYKKIHTIIENDRKTIESSFNEAEKAINALKDTVPPTPDKADDKTTTAASAKPATETGAKETPAKQESVIDKFFGPEKSVYSAVYGRYITEADGDREVTNKDSGTTSTTPQAQTGYKAVDNMRSVTGNDDNRSMEQKNKETQDAASKDMEAAINEINVYNNIATAIISAKMSTVEGAQKTYMKILRTHIKDHVGNKDSQSGANSARTDYRSPYDKSSDKSKQEQDDFAQSKTGRSVQQLQDEFKTIQKSGDKKAAAGWVNTVERNNLGASVGDLLAQAKKIAGI